jgi:hypothetical protein
MKEFLNEMRAHFFSSKLFFNAKRPKFILVLFLFIRYNKSFVAVEAAEMLVVQQGTAVRLAGEKQRCSGVLYLV